MFALINKIKNAISDEPLFFFPPAWPLIFIMGPFMDWEMKHDFKWDTLVVMGVFLTPIIFVCVAVGMFIMPFFIVALILFVMISFFVRIIWRFFQ